ncbi:flavoprotein [Tritonibacter mobilis]|uniref:flavoprotein n=1 Tax=Tritonibacter mobilis TaxID=379347 RepID=UPI003A5BE39A
MTSAPKPRILIGACGSLDLLMLPQHLRAIKDSIDCTLSLMLTPTAVKFVNTDALALLVDRLIHGDRPDDWPRDKPGRLAADHDLLAVLPTTANTLSAVANGSSQNRLTTVILAAEFPVLFFPVMGGPMWDKASVQRNVSQIRADGYEVFQPVWREHRDPHLQKVHGHHSLPDPADVVDILQSRLPAQR